MLLSMTGFGSAVAECATRKFTVELKSLNSKQLDLSMRCPAGYRQLEPEMRSMVASQLERGKVDFSLAVETVGGDGAVELNVPALEAYCRQIREASAKLGIPEPQDWYSVLMRFPDAVKTEGASEISDDERRVLLATLSAALDNILEHRAAEGRRLDEFFRVRIDRIRALLAEVPRYETERVAKIRARMQDALSSLHQVEYDKGRFEQEMIFYIEKLDINEEKQRLTQHLDYFLQTLDAKPGQGKKLGFIAQEMGREINTLGSKSNQAEMQILVVKMKDELEQIKEQVLNVM
ncbi:MAG: YicC family protein [[Clostridium] fimetarium]|nr:YicC family protein [Alistipes timonensis]MCM1405468.1 YicC family protein [[Clostridium] fimetarium]